SRTTLAGVSTDLYYDGTDLVAEYDGSNNLLRRYVHGPGVDEPLVWYEGSTTTNKTWLYTDHLGSVVGTANSAGTSTAIHSYGPFGEPNVSTGVRFRYTGQQLLGGLNLYYYKARFYSPALGRFLQTDPIGTADDLNLYAYVGNNPINLRDPSGEIACGGLCVTAIGIGVGFAFDYAIEAIRGSENSNATTALNAATGGAIAVTSNTQTKPRTGIAGGGRSGSGTSVASQLNHSAAQRGLYSIGTRNALSAILRKTPYVGYAYGAYELGDALYDRYNNSYSNQIDTSITDISNHEIVGK
ncbi:RHS repeat-associated core domain-containing protein, partial [Sedimenticola selenatireducens]